MFHKQDVKQSTEIKIRSAGRNPRLRSISCAGACRERGDRQFDTGANRHVREQLSHFRMPDIFPEGVDPPAGGTDLTTQKKKAREPRGVAAVDRAFAVLQAVESQVDPSTLADISVKTDLYKSTILRLIASLEGAGYITRLRDGRYTLGSTIFRLGLAYERANPLSEIVLPILQGLVKNGTESASLHIRHDAKSRICLLRVDSNHSTLDRVQAGDIFPVDRGAAGRILAAFDDNSGAKALRLREECFAISMGERDPACAGVACPVFGPEGVKAALSLSGPKERFTPAAITRMRELLLGASEKATRMLGAKYPKVRKDFDASEEFPSAQSSKG